MTQALPDPNQVWQTPLYLNSGENAEVNSYINFDNYGAVDDSGNFTWDLDGANALYAAFKAYAATLTNPDPYTQQTSWVTLDDPASTQVQVITSTHGFDALDTLLASWNIISPPTPSPS